MIWTPPVKPLSQVEGQVGIGFTACSVAVAVAARRGDRRGLVHVAVLAGILHQLHPTVGAAVPMEWIDRRA